MHLEHVIAFKRFGMKRPHDPHLSLLLNFIRNNNQETIAVLKNNTNNSNNNSRKNSSGNKNALLARRNLEVWESITNEKTLVACDKAEQTTRSLERLRRELDSATIESMRSKSIMHKFLIGARSNHRPNDGIM